MARAASTTEFRQMRTGYFVATVAGQAVAAISVVNHDPAMAFLGLHLRRPGFRRPEIGHALWQHALVHAGDRAVGLDGVAAQQRNYERSGFRPAGATLRLEGLATGANDKGILDLRDRKPLVNSFRNALSGLGSGKQGRRSDWINRSSGRPTDQTPTRW